VQRGDANMVPSPTGKLWAWKTAENTYVCGEVETAHTRAPDMVSSTTFPASHIN